MRVKVLVTIALALAAVSALAAPTAASSATSFTVLHSFGGPDGAVPSGPLVQGGDGFFYGVTASGGDYSLLTADGAGTTFRIAPDGTFATLHVFSAPDGWNPGSLIKGRDGFFYGTTSGGGVLPGVGYGSGTIFRMDATGKLTVLRTFSGSGGTAPGWNPGPIIQGADGALYGGADGGILTFNHYPGFVYRFDPATGDFRVLHNFVFSDGLGPTGPLLQSADGFLYGTTLEGGASFNPLNSWDGAGVVYRIAPDGTNFAVVHSFTGTDGSEPPDGVIQTGDGLLYGTTEGTFGGNIFRTDAAGAFDVLYWMGGCSTCGAAGYNPHAGPIQASNGLLYGTTGQGGPAQGGVVYRTDTAGHLTVLHAFGGPDGATPSGRLLQASDGLLYGTTGLGGAGGRGTVFRISPDETPLLPPISLTVTPLSVVGGSNATGTITLGWVAPPGGAVIALSDDSPLASVPKSVTVPENATSVPFTITTKKTNKSRYVTITATYNGQQVTAWFSVG